MPDQLVGRGHDVHRGTALGSAPRGLGAAEQNAELSGLGQEDALGRFSQPWSLSSAVYTITPASMQETVTASTGILALRSARTGIKEAFGPAFLCFIVSVFDAGQMARDHRAPDRDRLLIARLDGIARRHARWGGLTEAEKAPGLTELHGVAGDRRDLLAEVAGLALGTAEGKGQEYQARGQAIAELCRMAGADESLIPQWHQAGRQRAAMAAGRRSARPR
jgi:hypothetical protein